MTTDNETMPNADRQFIDGLIAHFEEQGASASDTICELYAMGNLVASTPPARSESQSGIFEPAMYISALDRLEYLTRDCIAIAQSINDWFDVLRENGTGDIVGFQLWSPLKYAKHLAQPTAAPVPAIPPGYVLMPVVPTLGMLAAFHDKAWPDLSSANRLQPMHEAYRAMIAAGKVEG